MESIKTTAPFFIVGAQRSGTTLLRLILNNHSMIAIPEEARFLAPLLTKKNLTTPLSGKKLNKTIKYLQLNSQFKQWNYDTSDLMRELEATRSIKINNLIDKIYTSFSQHEHKTVWADKSLFFRHIDILSEIFPDAKFIHLVRDGRDVFHSWRKMDKSKNNVATTAIDWNYKIHRIEKSFEKLPDHRKLIIRYEDLLKAPQETVHNICNFIGISFEPEMMNYHKTSQYYVGKHHSELIFQSIDSSNMYKWKNNLTDTEIRIYETLAGNNLRKHNYLLTKKESAIFDYPRIIYRILSGIPYRIYNVILIKLSNEIALRTGTASDKDAGEMPESRNR